MCSKIKSKTHDYTYGILKNAYGRIFNKEGDF